MYRVTHRLLSLFIALSIALGSYAQAPTLGFMPNMAAAKDTPQEFMLQIDKTYLNDPDFKYGFERIDGVPAYTRDVFQFKQYALVWKTKSAKGYFKYANKENNVFEPTENPNNPVGFLIAYRNLMYEWLADARTPNLPAFDIAWLCRPSDIQNENIPLAQVFKDIIREKVGNSGGQLKTQNLHLIMPNQANPDDPSTTKLLLWNNSHAAEVSFNPNRASNAPASDTTYQLFIPRADLTQTDFQYGLEKGEIASNDKMANVYYPVFYNNDVKYYFKYSHKKTLFAANRNNSDTLNQAYFVLSFLGNDLQPADLEFRRVPADKKNQKKSLEELFIDYFKIERKEQLKKVQLIYDTKPDPIEERLNRVALWNNSRAYNITFEVPSAYYYIDMSKVIDRDILIQELEEQMTVLEGLDKKFVTYISNGETPLIADDLATFQQIMTRLWILSPPTPSVGYDGSTIKAKIGPDIEFLAQNRVDFHFYTSDNLCSNSLPTLIKSILSDQAHEKTNVYIHLENQDDEGNTYFSKCKYISNTQNLRPNCLKNIRDKNLECQCH